MKLSQESYLSELKSKLSKMSELRDHLSLNDFKGVFTISRDTFGKLNLQEITDNVRLKGSTILSEKQALDLIKLCQFSPEDKWRLLYRGSSNGFRARDFHSNCDDIPHTLTIIKALGTNYIFGGFAEASWTSSHGYKSDPKAFLFSLTNKDEQPIRIPVDPSRSDYSLYMHDNFGPVFGTQNANDLLVADNGHLSKSNASDLGGNFKHPKYEFRSVEAQSFLAGSAKFQLSEIEVFTRD